MTIKPGDRIVARGLPFKPHSKTDRLPPRIALVCQVLPGRLVISLRVGGVGNDIRFAHKSRRCDPENVVRLATAREVATNQVIDPL